MRLAVVGATGAIGRVVVGAGLATGHEVSALTRHADRLRDAAHPHLHLLEGEAIDPAVIARLLTDVDAVITNIGAARNAPDEAATAEAVMSAIVTGMSTIGPRRLVALSGAAVTLPGDRKPLSGRIAARVVTWAARWVVEAKVREAAVIMASDLDWTLVRPPNVLPGPANASVGLRPSLPARTLRVTQGDVASALLRCAIEPIYVREAPFVA